MVQGQRGEEDGCEVKGDRIDYNHGASTDYEESNDHWENVGPSGGDHRDGPVGDSFFEGIIVACPDADVVSSVDLGHLSLAIGH